MSDDARAGPRWGLGDVALGLAVGFAAQTVVISVYLAMRDLPDDIRLDDLSLAVQLLLSAPGLWIGLVAVPLLVSRTKGRGPVTDFGLRSTWRDARTGLLAGIGTQVILVPLLYAPLLRLLDKGPEDVEEAARELTDRAGGFGTVVLVLVVCIGAPLAEELFYRGLVLRATEKRFGSTVAIAGSSVLFGASHLQWLQFPALVVFGAVAAVLVVRSGRLGPAIWAHVGFNSWTVFALLVLD
jgi:uncharacterized protein